MELFYFLVTICLSLAFSGRCSDDYSRNDFPEGFVFGSAVSAFQWEGAVDEDGRMPSVLDTTVHSSNGSSGIIACDGYHKYKEDVRLMYDMGLDAFRLSISWSRLIPSGRGPVNPKGLLFYKNLIQELKRHGIEPHVTLYHDDLPQALEDEYGGWKDRKIIKDFTAYADVCFREFGNTVKFWSTINEPNMLALVNYGVGFLSQTNCTPPFEMVNCTKGNTSTEPYIVLHNMLLAHASTARLYKQNYKHKQNGSVGITFFAFWMVPFTTSEEDEIATQRAKDFLLGWVLHPLVFGDYPNVMRRIVGKRLPCFSEEESYLVKDSSDFLGVIHYTTTYTTADLSSPSQRDFLSDMAASMIPIGNSTLFTIDVLPWGLEGVLEYIKQNYGNPPVYILENGRPTNHHSPLNDVERIEYLHAYIAAVLNSVRNGSETKGYFQWSFMDLFEFINSNYTYGLYYVNFSDPERKRSPKTSALWYSCFLNGTTTCSQDLKNISLSSSPGLSSS
ncbi:Beta-glucosidase 8 [Raphanus sativus]|uniref:Sinigrinase n=1 Tax=Raphanus sativus TaxID=3726 RepID=A0A6J0MW81_RAPSA|nr:beta-glucosidase 8-like isoform X1 [Raphanus sativus]XP_018476424.1 beta-glucosidase 8-like isoform X1 [Raphanus sativus]XP_056860500.1 beta-glucosidase 8-like isoform X1 [Raphanus sativus]XP_056860501.1 beta-glucosidase 8-like isoform X1 [Raphanus sativus]KAJ4906516.1 Beta-glucosidase 8 [Raphanus sativus]